LIFEGTGKVTTNQLAESFTPAKELGS
jgi:hypothetical protein